MSKTEDRNVSGKILQLIAHYTAAPDSDNFDPDTDVASLELDSLALFELVYEIEERFAIELDESDLEQITTVRDLISSVEAAI